jgi:hypothetical protein
MAVGRKVRSCINKTTPKHFLVVHLLGGANRLALRLRIASSAPKTRCRYPTRKIAVDIG